MELAIKNNVPKSKKNKNKTTSTELIVKPAPKKSKKPKQKSKKQNNSTKSLESYFIKGMTRPDIVGPIRVPRMGGGSRTVLGFDKATAQLGSTTTWTALIGFSQYTQCGVLYSATAANALFTTVTTIVPGAQYPANTQVLDANIVGATITVTYIGAPLNATGEILIGSIPNGGSINMTNTDFNTLSNYPGVVRFPISDLINGNSGPKTAYMKKYSPLAWDFIVPSLAQSDCEMPFIACTPLASANSITFQIQRSWETHPTFLQANALPYDSVSDSFSKDMEAFQNAAAIVANVPASVQDSYGEYLMDYARSNLGTISMGLGSILGSSIPSLYHYVSNRHMNRVRNSAIV